MEPTPPPTGPVGSPGPDDQGPGQSPAQGYPPPGQAYPPPGQNPYPPGQGGAYPPGGGYPPPGPGGFQQPYPGGPGQPQAGRKTSVLAILAFLFGLIAFVPIALILGIVALIKIGKSGDRGKGFAIAGLVLSVLWVAGIVAAVTLIEPDEAERDASGQVTTTQNVQSNKLRVGDCVTEIKEGEVRDIAVQPCAQPNGGKVFAVFDLPAGKWPGLTEVQTAAEKGCTDRYEASNQQASEPSSIWYLHPVDSSWALGDHGVTCLVAPK